MLDARFQIHGASLPGSEHLLHGRLVAGGGNQDAFCLHADADVILAVACDGCGSGAHSGVGAHLGARLILAGLRRSLTRGPAPVERHLERARRRTLRALGALATRLPGPREALVRETLLFTVVGLVVTADTLTVFGLGDGLYAVNDAIVRLGPFPDNAPPYLGYALLPGAADDPGLRLRVLHRTPTAAVRSAALGTDGAADLADAADRRVPGRDERVGAIARLWQDDRFARNPDALLRWLRLVGSPVVEPGDPPTLRPGLLRDDTTLVILRRREAES